MEVLSTVMQDRRVAGTVTGYDETQGFKGTATTRGTLNLWLLSQAKFNGLKVLALWARLGECTPRCTIIDARLTRTASPAWASGMVLDDESEWLVSPDWADGLPLSHSAGFENIKQEASGQDMGHPDYRPVDFIRGAAVRDLTTAELDARVPAVQVMMLRGVTQGALKHMGEGLTSAKTELKSLKKNLNRLSHRAEGAFTNWPWSENGAAVRGCTHRDINPEDEDYFPLAVVSRSVNNILKMSFRKIDEQIAQTERVRSTVSDLREELDETSAVCDEALQQIEKQGKHAEDLKDECESLRETVYNLQKFNDTVAAEGAEEAEGKPESERPSRLEQELEMHKFKGGLFDRMCQEIRMLPFGLKSVELAGRCLDSLRHGVRWKESLLEEKWGPEAYKYQRREDEDQENQGEANENLDDADMEGYVEDTSRLSYDSPVPASSESGWSVVSEEQY